MPSALPAGDPAPDDGHLPEAVLASLTDRAWAFYVHVPFCASRCGYCDFNTYTATELGGTPHSLGSAGTWAASAQAEIALARRVVGEPRPIDTIFFGGGTPTLLPASDLVATVGALRDTFGLAPDAEITTEANPDSVTPESLAELRAGGVNRISFGMQSSVAHVLSTLDRTHDPERVPLAVEWARAAGFEQVSLDLIYGTPGETADDWRTSLEAALACAPDHVSAYSLIVEDGTALARQVAAGLIPMPDDDDHADKYLIADELLSRAGLGWYEVSNWARDPQSRCRHNLAYWRGDNWWGIGPGAHSHIGGVRWWNVKHPRAWAERLDQGLSPAHARELLTAEDQQTEAMLLLTRLAEGFDRASVPDPRRLDCLLDAGLVVQGSDGRWVLTVTGRLAADFVTKTLLGW